jgi:4-diphosphocytidyl-2-C-methyl-D-erythritol kinase
MTVKAYAKINLTLEVLGKREDGFHALRSVVLPVSLYDEIVLDPAENISSDYLGENDLCVKAAKELLPKGLGVSIKIKKNIPVGGGLGGGSADAAAVIFALNEMFSLHKSSAELIDVAAKIGSDVPALLFGRDGNPVLMEGRGEYVSSLGIKLNKPLHFVLVNPFVNSSTKEVFKNCISCVTSDSKILYNMRHALEMGSAKEISEALFNDLQEPAQRLYPRIAEAKKALEESGGRRVLMSGSGSTVFCVAENSAEAESLAAEVAKKGLWAFAVQTIVP